MRGSRCALGVGRASGQPAAPRQRHRLKSGRVGHCGSASSLGGQASRSPARREGRCGALVSADPAAEPPRGGGSRSAGLTLTPSVRQPVERAGSPRARCRARLCCPAEPMGCRTEATARCAVN